MLRRLLRLFARRPPPPPPRPTDPRLAQDPWLAALFAQLGERYQLEPSGTRVLRRTGRARFNPMAVWIEGRVVRGEYEVRGAGEREAVAAQARALLDARIAAPLAQLGLAQRSESVEEWAGTVLTRRYEGAFDDAQRAAEVVRYFCEESEQQLNLAAE